MVVIVSVAYATFYATVQFGLEIRRVEKLLDSQFKAIEARAAEHHQANEQRFLQQQQQIDQAWTVHMMALRDSMVAHKNTNNWIPDSYRIYEAVRGGKPIEPVRITP